MKIGILGTGNVGQALGLGFAALGHEVKMGSRDPHQEKIKNWVNQAGSKASSGTFEQAAAFSELAVLCTVWSGAETVSYTHLDVYKRQIEARSWAFPRPARFRPGGAFPLTASTRREKSSNAGPTWM